MRLICWWLGTDSFTLNNNPPGFFLWRIKLFFYRVKWRILHRFFNQHWAVNDRVADQLERFGVDRDSILIRPDAAKLTKVENVQHKGFRVLYYMPIMPKNLGGIDFLRWLYGYDIFSNIKNLCVPHRDLSFVVVYGMADTLEVLRHVDFYLRLNRWDGESRLVTECKYNDIPYYQNTEGNPSAEEAYKQIMNEYERKVLHIN